MAARAGDLAPRPELVPAAGAAMADTDCRTIKADRRHHVFAWRTIGADQRLAKVGAVAGPPAGHRDPFADRADDAGDKLAAIDVEPVGQNENADQVGRRQ